MRVRNLLILAYTYVCGTVTPQVVVMVAPVCVTQQTIKLLRFNFNFRRLYYVRTTLHVRILYSSSL